MRKGLSRRARRNPTYVDACGEDAAGPCQSKIACSRLSWCRETAFLPEGALPQHHRHASLLCTVAELFLMPDRRRRPGWPSQVVG
jgi:hypothetical protein